MKNWLGEGEERHPHPRYEFARKPSKCPTCGSERVANIQYGLPAFTPELERDLAAKKIVLGGCCITLDDPAWKCVSCGERMWRKRKSVGSSPNE